jgi:hypothetical protein
MHYAVLVVLDRRRSKGKTIPEEVEEMLKAYASGKYDWYQLGGRWTGVLSDYDPEKDPQNFDQERNRVKWPTEWASHEGDVLPLSQVSEEKYNENHFYGVLVPYFGYFEGEMYQPWGTEKFKKQELPPLGWLQENFPEGLAVVVDIHN